MSREIRFLVVFLFNILGSTHRIVVDLMVRVLKRLLEGMGFIVRESVWLRLLR